MMSQYFFAAYTINGDNMDENTTSWLKTLIGEIHGKARECQYV